MGISSARSGAIASNNHDGGRIGRPPVSVIPPRNVNARHLLLEAGLIGTDDPLAPHGARPAQLDDRGLDGERVAPDGRRPVTGLQIHHDDLHTLGRHLVETEADGFERLGPAVLEVADVLRMIHMSVGIELVESNLERRAMRRWHQPTVTDCVWASTVLRMTDRVPVPAPEPFRFIGSQGTELVGRLHRPAGEAKGSVLLAHCFTCSMEIHTMTRLAKGLADAGYAALRFDFTGIGESGGDFAEKTVSANVSDLTRAAASLIVEGFGPCAMIGHSLGGAAAILAASRLKTVRSLVTIGAPSDPLHVRHLFDDDLETLATHGRASVTIAGRSFDLEQGFIDDLGTHDVLEAVAGLDRPYLVIHAADDDVVGVEHGEALFAAAHEPKRFERLASGGHLLGPRTAAEAALDAIIEWFERTL